MPSTSPFRDFPLSVRLIRAGGFCLLTLMASLNLAFPEILFAQDHEYPGGDAGPPATTYPGQARVSGLDLVAVLGTAVWDPFFDFYLDVAPGSTHEIDFLVGNLGYEGTDRPVVEKIFFSQDLVHGNGDDILLATTAPHVIGPRGVSRIRTSIQIPHGLARGYYYLYAVADGDHAVAEVRENNNYSFGGFRVLGGDDGPDLGIEWIFNSEPIPDPSQSCGGPDKPPCGVCGDEGQLPCVYVPIESVTQRCGLPLAIRARIEYLNDGHGTARGDLYRFRTFLGDHPLDADPIEVGSQAIFLGLIRPGGRTHAEVDLALPADMPEGSYSLRYQVDADNILEEGNEINNYKGTVVHVKADVDLAPENLIVHGERPDGSYTRPHLPVGQSADIEYRVRNLDVSGTASTFREVVWLADHQGRLLRSLYASPVHGEVLCYQVGAGVNAKESLDVALSIPLGSGLEPGDYQIVVEADGLDDLEETDEANNYVSQAILLIPPTGDRDLVLGDQRIEPSGSVDPGESFLIHYTLENWGVEPVSGPFRERFYLSRDDELDPDQDVLVAVGPAHFVTIDAREGESPGTYNTSVTAMTPPDTPPGDYRLLTQLDVDNEVPETREGNNLAAGPVVTLGTQGCNEGPIFSGLDGADFVSGAVELSWLSAGSSCSPRALEYTVYRASSSSLAALLARPIASGLTSLSFRDASAVPGSTYWYLVRCTDVVNGLEEENARRLAVTVPAVPGMFFQVSPGGSAGAAVDPGTEVILSWNIPGATGSVLVGIGGFGGPSGSAAVDLEETTTFVLYATVNGLQEVHTATGHVLGSLPQAQSHGPCHEPASAAIEIDGVLHYCRGVRNAQEPHLDKPAVWIPYTAADWELLVGPAAHPWSPYCFSGVDGDGQYVPFRYHVPGTAPNEWRTAANVSGLPEIPGDGLDNNCNDLIDE